MAKLGPIARTKKGKAGGKDFKKRTAKVGKKATKAANVTKVNLKSKQLYMPSQRLATPTISSSTHKPIPTSSTGKTLPELLHQCHHHNTSTRTMALHGLKELILAFPHTAIHELSSLLDAALDLLLDTENDVRVAVLSFLRTLFLLPNLSQALVPFAPLASTYLCSVLTHLDQSIRRDGLAYMDLLVGCLGVKMVPFLGEILPSLGLLLERPPQASKRKAAKMHKEAKIEEREGARGGEGRGEKDKGKDQAEKVRLELWLARVAVLRSVVGIARLLSLASSAAGSNSTHTHTHTKPSTKKVTVDWSRQSRMLLLRGTSAGDVKDEEEEGREVEEEKKDEEASAGVGGPVTAAKEALQTLLPKVTNYVLELTTTAVTITSKSHTHTHTHTQQQEQGQQQQIYHQIETGPMLEVLSAAVELALVASHCTTTNTHTNSNNKNKKKGRKSTERGAEGGGKEMDSLLHALLGLFPVQLADGASAGRGGQTHAHAHTHKHTAMDMEVEEEDKDDESDDDNEEPDISTLTHTYTHKHPPPTSQDGLNLYLVEIMVLTHDSLPPVALSWLFRFMHTQTHTHTQTPTTAASSILLRVLRTTLLSLFTTNLGADERLAEQLLVALQTCTHTWPLSSPQKRTVLRLCCDVLPYRHPAKAREWVKEAAKVYVCEWARGAAAAAGGGGASDGGSGGSNLCLTLLEVLREEIVTHTDTDTHTHGEGEGGEGGGEFSWLPEVLTPLLDPAAFCHLSLDAQLRALDLLYYCPSFPAPLLSSLQALIHDHTHTHTHTHVKYIMELLHHRRRAFSPSAYLTLLGQFLDIPPFQAHIHTHTHAHTQVEVEERKREYMRHAHRVGESVGCVLGQLQMGGKELLVLLAPLLKSLLMVEGTHTYTQEGEEGKGSTGARKAALVVVCMLGRGGGSAYVLPINVVPEIVEALLVSGEDEEGSKYTNPLSLTHTHRTLRLAILQRHSELLLPAMVAHLVNYLQAHAYEQKHTLTHTTTLLLEQFDRLVQEPSLRGLWAPAKDNLIELRDACVCVNEEGGGGGGGGGGEAAALAAAKARLRHDLDLLPLGLKKIFSKEK